MKFVICFYLTAYITNCGIAVKLIRSEISFEDLYIPKNSWFSGEWDPPGSTKWDQWYDAVMFYQNITPDSQMILYYEFQEYKSGFRWGFWDTTSKDKVLLCDTSKNTEGASVVAFIRKFLGLYQKCSVVENTTIDTTYIDFPIINQKLILNTKINKPSFKILTTLWDNDTSSAEKTFIGNFYIKSKGRHAYV